MATDFESIAAILYSIALFQLFYALILVLFIYVEGIRPWIQRGKIWKKIVDNTRGGVSAQMLMSYMKVYSNDTGKIWMMAAEVFDEIGDKDSFENALRQQWPNIAAISDPSDRHQAMRMMPDEPRYPYFITYFMNPADLDEKRSVGKRLREMF